MLIACLAERRSTPISPPLCGFSTPSTVRYAEIWRKLGPIAARLGRPSPSYHCVRQYLVAERRRKLAQMALANAVVDDVVRGMAPWSVIRALS